MGNDSSTPGQYGKKINNDILIKWQKIATKCPFAAREGQAVCVWGTKLYTFGGVMFIEDPEGQGGQDVETNDLLVYDPATKKWEQEKCIGVIPPQRSGACLSSVGNCLYLFGGLSQICGWMNDLYMFDVQTKRWSKIDTVLSPSPRDKVLSVPVGNKLYVFGGFGPAPEEDADDALADIDENDEEYEDMEEEELQEMRTQNAANFTWSNELFVFDTEEKKWSIISPSDATFPTARAAHSLDLVTDEDGKQWLYVFGGKDSVSRQNDLWRFDLDSCTWQVCESKGCKPQPRSFHASAVVENRLIIHGGRGVSNNHFSDFNIFDINTKEWLQPDASSEDGNEPPAVGLHKLCVIRDEIILFGGSSDLDPATGTCMKIYNDIYAVKTEDVLKGGAIKEEEEKGDDPALPAMLNLKAAKDSSSVDTNQALAST